MINKEKINSFNDYALNKVYFYIESKFWSKLDIDTLHGWLHNFKSLEEKYCAFKLLDRFVYYSEEDIVRLIDYGLNELVLKKKIFDYEVSTDFKGTNEDLLKIKSDFYDNSCILPLLTDNLSESSLAMIRYLTNDLSYPESKVLDINNIKSNDLKNVKHLIIIDDYIGSSNQLHTFWNFTKIRVDNEEIITKRLKSKFPNLEIEYFCLVCTENGFLNFTSKNMDDVPLKISYCEMLTDKYKVFGADSIYFDNNEIEECKNILDNICQKNKIDFLGYESLDYAIAFHHSIPDSSLPLFYKQTSDWNPLFKNKKTLS